MIDDPWEVQCAETVAFVRGAWSRFGTGDEPVRLLDVGAGEGRAGRALADAGFAVRGLEPDAESAAKARERGLEVTEADVTAWVPGDRGFHIILFGRSLHHVPAVDEALRVACSVLVPGGLVVLEEFAHDAADEATAAWIERRFEEGVRTGELRDPAEDEHEHHHDESPRADTALGRWRQRFAHDPPLHGGAVLLDALRRIVGPPVLVETVPYLYRWIESHQVQVRSGRIREALAAERNAIERGTIRPVGLRAIAISGGPPA